MPAVHADPLTLPRLSAPDVTARERAVRSITTAPEGFEGEGFPVRRAFAGVSRADLDPFIHMDQMGEVNYAPYEPRGTDWHPHRGFETVTYIMDGTFIHQDSHGGGGIISNGATQWMTAGAGILHIETPPEDLVIKGGLFHGVQLWVNLPAKDKMLPPAYQSLEAEHVKLFASTDGASLIRLIAGDVGEFHGPASTHTPIAMAHASVSPGARVTLPWNPNFNALVYVLDGHGTVGQDRHPIRTGQLAVMGEGDVITFDGVGGNSEASSMFEVLILGGQPIREPIAVYGPFVMNTREELIQAFEDFQSGRLGQVPEDGIRPYRG